MGLKEAVTEITVGSGRLVLLEGPSGVGKTYQASTLIEGGLKVLVASGERKLKTIEKLLIASKSKVYTIEDFDYPDPSQPADYNRLKESPQRNLYQRLSMLLHEEHDYDVLYIDSFMRIMWRMLMQISATNPNADRRSDFMPLGRKAKNALDHLATLTDATVMKRPMHVVATWGVEPELDPIDGGKKLMPSMDGTKIAPVVAYYFDDVILLRTKLDENGGTVYTANVQANPQFDAKVSSPVKLPSPLVNPNLMRIIKALQGELEVK